MHTRTALALLAAASLLSVSGGAQAQSPYLLFEGGPVRPLALSPDGSQLFVANAPENHLEIFDVGPTGLLSLAGSVPVGMEPVTVVARTNNEVWVVNHLSDSISIVDVSSTPPRVTRTLLVGDEPRDLVFAGSPERAFITTAHRGQHRTHASVSGATGAGDPQLTTEGIGRADVWVFDAASPGSDMGVPVEILSFFADTPRALATDGTTVYLAAFHSGNQTTAIPQTVVDVDNDPTNGGPNHFFSSCDGTGKGQGVPEPNDNASGDPAPATGLIVKWNGSNWVDALGCTWDHVVELNLPDHDVFAVNANTLASGTVFDHVGTILFNMALNPTTGKLYVSNTESPNHIRFEGPGDHGGSTVQGRLSESRISVLTPSGPSVDVQHLNKHIDYAQLHTDAGANHAAIDAQAAHSLATPLQVLVDDANQKVYVAAFGSRKVGVFDAAEIEDPAFEANYQPTTQSGDYISTGGGPAGLALGGDRLYVYTRFDNRVEVHDVSGAPGAPLQTAKLPTAEPASVVDGRPFLYDALLTSANGEASCSSCHIFGDFDSLAWNLGNPDDHLTTDTQPMSTPVFEGAGPPIDLPNFHPMKGPMTTQTLRGMSTHGGMHWRGDRVDGFFGTDPCNGSSLSNAPCDEDLSFNNFIVAFEGLVGREQHIGSIDMQKFTDFSLQLMQPPNPVAELDNSRTTPQQAGHDTYFSCGPGTTECSVFNDPDATDTVEDCDGCHDLDPAAGFFGSGGEKSFENEPQNFKVAQLRNMYAKVGMFGTAGSGANLGDQVRGFGFLHDGSVDTLKTFLEAGVFDFSNRPGTPTQEREQLEQLMLAFPSDLAPIVGQQVSVGPSSPGSTVAASHPDTRVTLLDARAAASFDSFVLGGAVTECELIAKTVEGGVVKGYYRQSANSFLPDDGGSAITEAALRAKAASQDLQYTCAPPGSGLRMGIDRDLDDVLDGQDNCPAWPNGAGGGSCTDGDPALLAAKCSSNGECGGGGVCSLAQEDANSNSVGDACEPALLPEPSGALALLLGAGLLLALRRSGRAG